MTDPYEVLHATWPPARSWTLGPFTLRDGAGGGKRVDAATTRSFPNEEEITGAERAMDRPGRQVLFAVRSDQNDFDRMLAERGYLVLDPTLVLTCLVEALVRTTPPVSGFTVWPPLQVQRDIWAEGRIGPERLAVMDRVAGPKTSILGRTDDRPSATAFAAIHDTTAMVHALEVRKAARRQGAAGHIMAHAARWAQAQGAETMAVLVTEANVGAVAFYRRLGMDGARCYHYRVRP